MVARLHAGPRIVRRAGPSAVAVLVAALVAFVVAALERPSTLVVAAEAKAAARIDLAAPEVADIALQLRADDPSLARPAPRKTAAGLPRVDLLAWRQAVALRGALGGPESGLALRVGEPVAPVASARARARLMVYLI